MGIRHQGLCSHHPDLPPILLPSHCCWPGQGHVHDWDAAMQYRMGESQDGSDQGLRSTGLEQTISPASLGGQGQSRTPRAHMSYGRRGTG